MMHRITLSKKDGREYRFVFSTRDQAMAFLQNKLGKTIDNASPIYTDARYEHVAETYITSYALENEEAR